MQEGCIMLFTYYSFLLLFCRNEKGLLNFVSGRIIFLQLVYGINNTPYSFKKNKLPFKLLQPHFIGRILSNLSPYLNINYCFTGRALKIYDLLYSTLKQVKQLINTCVVPFAIAEFGLKCLEVASTLKYEPLNSCTTVHSV